MEKIGGQAVIEGVMMKSGQAWTVAVRDPKGEIHVKREALRRLPRLLRLPLLRGVVTLVHTLTIGISALEYSASKAYEDEEQKPLSRASIAATIGVAFILGIGLFILLPLYAAKLMGLLIAAVAESSLLFNLADGVIRVAVFLLYVVLISLWGEIGRIFEYHGAEHKAIHALEAGRDLEVGNVKAYSPHHPRCGTSFLMIVMIVSIMVFSFIPQSWAFLWKASARVVLLPLIAGVSYEALRLSARMKDNPFVKVLVLPGLMLQRLTAREPDESQLEVAIRALTEVLEMEETGVREA
jgi:uncharacterized protein YqhQ